MKRYELHRLRDGDGRVEIRLGGTTVATMAAPPRRTPEGLALRAEIVPGAVVADIARAIDIAEHRGFWRGLMPHGPLADLLPAVAVINLSPTDAPPQVVFEET